MRGGRGEKVFRKPVCPNSVSVDFLIFSWQMMVCFSNGLMRYIEVQERDFG